MPPPDVVVPADRQVAVRAALAHEMVESERRRVTLLIAMLVLLAVAFVAVRFLPSLMSADVYKRMMAPRFTFIALLLGCLLYEVATRAWLGRLLASRRPLPGAFHYLNSTLELAIPTLALVVGAASTDPLSILAGAIPFVYFLFILLAALSLDVRVCVFAGCMACAQFLTTAMLLLRGYPVEDLPAVPVLSMATSPHQYIMKGLFMVAAGLIAGFVASQIRGQMRQVVQTLEERDRAVSIFGQHVSPQVADLLLKQPMDFTGQERRVCVMFLDIRDFSKLAAERTAAEVVSYLNVLFERMIPIVNAHRGIVNKFLGDGFMAVFGAPVSDGQECRSAVDASLEILATVKAMNLERAVEPTRVGIGLHVGEAVTGNVGTSERKEYTIIGDVVNLASRIEQANKPLNSDLLVSEAVKEAVPHIPATDMGRVELKGQPHPVRLFKLA